MYKNTKASEEMKWLLSFLNYFEHEINLDPNEKGLD